MKIKLRSLPHFSSYIIDADSTPLHDGWGPGDYWDCDDYIAWYKSMKDKYGKKYAMEHINAEFTSDKLGLFAHEKFCAYSPTFVNYFRNEGFPAESVLGSAIANVGNTVVTVTDTTSNAGNLAANASKVLLYAVPVILALAAGGLVYYGYAKYLKNIKPA